MPEANVLGGQLPKLSCHHDVESRGRISNQCKDLSKREAVIESINRFFKPEFINRISAIVVFNPLSRSNIRKVVELRLIEVQGRLKEKNISLNLDDSAKDWLGAAGYSPAYGARPLNRVIQTEVWYP
jgi:ATP-dependent Clp protease ATP-binding subunit ClpA